MQALPDSNQGGIAMTDEYRLTAQEQIATAILAGNGHTTVAQALQLADDMLAETRGRVAPDPYRVDPDDLEHGEMVLVWDGPRDPESFRLFSGYGSRLEILTKPAHGVGNSVAWRHCRRARPEEIDDA
jgi:hypothetical protein